MSSAADFALSPAWSPIFIERPAAATLISASAISSFFAEAARRYALLAHIAIYAHAMPLLLPLMSRHDAFAAATLFADIPRYTPAVMMLMRSLMLFCRSLLTSGRGSMFEIRLPAQQRARGA